MTGLHDLPDPLPGVSGDAADVDLTDSVVGGFAYGFRECFPTLLDRILGTPVSAGCGFEFAGHVTSLTDRMTPNKFGLRTPSRLCQTGVRKTAC